MSSISGLRSKILDYETYYYESFEAKFDCVYQAVFSIGYLIIPPRCC